MSENLNKKTDTNQEVITNPEGKTSEAVSNSHQEIVDSLKKENFNLKLLTVGLTGLLIIGGGFGIRQHNTINGYKTYSSELSQEINDRNKAVSAVVGGDMKDPDYVEYGTVILSDKKEHTGKISVVNIKDNPYLVVKTEGKGGVHMMFDKYKGQAAVSLEGDEGNGAGYYLIKKN